jgi:hypothetical protein
VLEEALPLLIEHKDAFHLLLKQVRAPTLPWQPPAPWLPSHHLRHLCHRPYPWCQVEKTKPKLLQPALTDAMSHFSGEAQEGLAPSSPKKVLLSSVQRTAALSMRRVELEATPSSIPASFLRLKLRSFISRLHLRTSVRVAVAQSAMEEPPDRWMKIWHLLITDPDDAVRDVARQARQILRDPAPKSTYPQAPIRSAAHSLHCWVPHATPLDAASTCGGRPSPATRSVSSPMRTG